MSTSRLAPLEKNTPPGGPVPSSPRSGANAGNASDRQVEEQQAKGPRTPRNFFVTTPRSTTAGDAEERPGKRATTETAVQGKRPRSGERGDLKVAVGVAEQKMAEILKALAGGSVKDIQSGCEAFDNALAPLNPSASQGPLLVEGVYNRGLRMRLEAMPQAELEGMSKAAGVHSNVHEAIQRVHTFAVAEIARREAVLLSADRRMAQFVRAIASGDASAVRSCAQAFHAELSSLNGQGPDYGARLRVNLDLWPSRDLEAAGLAALDLLESGDTRLDSALIQMVDAAVKDALLAHMNDAFRTVDAQMANVLDALASGDARRLPSLIQAFEATVTQAFPHTRDDVFSFNAVKERLQWRLRTMPWAQLDNLCHGVLVTAEKVTHPVVGHMGFSVLAEYVRRPTQELGAKGAGGALSEKHTRSELRDLANLASALLASAQELAPNATPGEHMLGTALTQRRLSEIKAGLNVELAICIVRESRFKSVGSMTVDEREDVVWAVQLCRDQDIQFRPKNGYLGFLPVDPWDEELKRLARSIRYFEERSSSSRPSNSSSMAIPLRSADDEMEQVLEVLLADGASADEVHACSKRFTQAMKRQSSNSSQHPALEGDHYSKRLQLRLENMDPVKLMALVDAAAEFQAGDPVIALFGKAALEAKVAQAGLLLPWTRAPKSSTPQSLAEENLWAVFMALRSKSVKEASDMNTDFLRMVKKRSVSRGAQAFTADVYGERLRFRVSEMPIKRLQEYQQLAANFPDKENPLVQRIGALLSDELQRRNDELQRRQEAETDVLLRLTSADPHMKTILEGLQSSNDLKTAEGVEDFVKALQPRGGGAAIGDGAAFDMYKDRLKTRLSRLPEAAVKAMEKGAATYLEHLQDPVVEGIRDAVKDELQQRVNTRKSLASAKERQTF